MAQQFYSKVSILEISKCVHRDMYMYSHSTIWKTGEDYLTFFNRGTKKGACSHK